MVIGLYIALMIPRSEWPISADLYVWWMLELLTENLLIWSYVLVDLAWRLRR